MYIFVNIVFVLWAVWLTGFGNKTISITVSHTLDLFDRLITPILMGLFGGYTIRNRTYTVYETTIRCKDTDSK